MPLKFSVGRVCLSADVLSVAGSVAGDMEAEYNPFVSGDEVMVIIPEGDERAGCTIIGRLNNGLDRWPGGIAGQDATLNNFAFKRTRAPFIHEFADSYMLRNATSNAFFSISRDGQLLMSNADHAFLSMTPDFIGMQSGDAQMLIQMDLGAGNIVLQAGKLKPPSTTTLTIGADTTFFSAGTVEFHTAGQYGVEHAASAEGVANMVYNVLVAMWSVLIAPLESAVVGATGSKVFATPLTAFIDPAAIITAMNTGLAASGTASIAPFAAAVAAALAAKVPGDSSGTMPSVGSPGLLIG